MKKYCVPILICIFMLFFVWMPFSRAGLSIQFYLEEFEGDLMVMYYTTVENPQMGMEQICVGEIDRENNVVVFRFPPELADRINGIRLDFPDREQMLKIRNVSVSSGGVIRKNYDPCDFFAETNIVSRNGISDISLLESTNMVYLSTQETDPYILFGGGLQSDVFGQRSNYRLTRILVCILVIAGYVSYRLRLFDEEGSN